MNFLDALQQRAPLLADGATGTMLQVAGLPTYYGVRTTEPSAPADNSLVVLSGSNALEVAAGGVWLPTGVVLKAPNGSRWQLAVDNNGILQTISL